MNTYIPDSKNLDGKQLYFSFLAGAQRIFESQDTLNKINVFPVADADTGTNLASTFRAITDTSIPTGSLKQTATAIADAALTGARGNSGIILAQFLYGFSNEITDEQSIDVASFSKIVKKSVKYAYEAISNPVEGTIITVLRDWAEFIESIKDKFDDFQKLIIASYQRAKESLNKTTLQLEALAKANVVDAGAQGFVHFLEGMIDFFEHSEIKRILPARNVFKLQAGEVKNISHEELTYRYCTEAMLSGEKLEKEKIKEQLRNMGDSFVIAGSLTKLRIHIHTDHPADLFEVLSQYGSIQYQKVDDMLMQKQIAEKPNSNIALLTDSTCDLPQELLEKYQIQVVPLTIHFGDTYYLDGISLKADKFYQLFKTGIQKPSTAQPAFGEFSNKYSYLCTHYKSIIALHLSSALSGTCSNSKKAAKTIGLQLKKPIAVVDSKKVSGALGLQVLRLAQAVEDNKYTPEELVKLANSYTEKSYIFVSLTTLKHMVRSGRVKPVKGWIARLLNLRPVITFDAEGKSRILDKAFSETGSSKKLLKQVQKVLKEGKCRNYCITHADNLQTAKYYAEEISKFSGHPPLFIKEVSPVLGCHAGPGTVAVSLMME